MFWKTEHVENLNFGSVAHLYNQARLITLD